jgi:hypothetical protein
MTTEREDEDVITRVVSRWRLLGRELVATVYVSERERAILLAPWVFQSEPWETLRHRMPADAAATAGGYQNGEAGVRLPFDSRLEEVGREALRVLAANVLRPFDPWALPRRYMHLYLDACFPDEGARASFVELFLTVNGEYSLEMTVDYEDPDVVWAGLEARVPLRAGAVVIGAWILRLASAYRTVAWSPDGRVLLPGSAERDSPKRTRARSPGRRVTPGHATLPSRLGVGPIPGPRGTTWPGAGTGALRLGAMLRSPAGDAAGRRSGPPPEDDG